MPLFASDLTVNGGRLKPPSYTSTANFPTAASSEGTVVYESTNNLLYLSDATSWLKLITGNGANQQVAYFNSGHNLTGSTSLIFTGTSLGVGGSPSANIHAVSGYIRSDGILYSIGAGAPASSSFASAVRLRNTTANMNWHISNRDDGTLDILDDNGIQMLKMDSFGSTVFGTGAVDYSAILALNSTTTGFLPPRMTTTQRDAISTPTAGLLLYNTTTNALTVRLASSWLELGGGGGSAAGATGNVQFKSAGGGFAADSLFTYDDTNNRLGIGVSTPFATLNVRGTVTGSLVAVFEDDSGADILDIFDNGHVKFGNNESYPILYPATTGGVLSLTGSGLAYSAGITTGNQDGHYFTHNQGTMTTGSFVGVAYGGTITLSSGSADFSAFETSVNYTVNGTASGKQRAFWANDTITAVVDYRQFEASVNSGKGFWQTGSSAINLFAGNTGFGTATSPAYILDIGSTGGMRLPSGSDAQRPTAATSVFRYSTTANSPEFYDGTAWRTMLHNNNGVIGTGTASYLAYWNGTNIITGDIDAQFDGTVMSLGTSVVGGQRLTIVGTGSTSGTYALRVHNSGGTNNQFVVRDDGMVGILQNAPIYPLHVGGSAVFGTAGANTTNSTRTFNLYDAAAVARIWRKTNTTNAGPAVELIWGPVTGGNDSATHTSNRYWDFYVSGSADQFGIRKRSGGTDVVAWFIQPEMDIQAGPNTTNSIRGGTAISQAASKNSVIGDRQISRFALSTNSNTNTSFDLYLNGSSAYADIDNSPATSKVWGCNISLTILVTARTSGTPIIGDSMTFNYVGHIKKIAGVYSNSTFTQTGVSGDASLNATTVSITVSVSGQLIITVTRPAGAATYAAVATVETQEIAY